MAQLDIPFRIVAINAEERVEGSLPAHRVAEQLARNKSAAYTLPLAEGEVLLTADTVVVLDDTVLGKPRGHEEAKAMLQALSGRVHQVYSGVMLRTNCREVSFTERTDVHFRPLTQREIDYYVNTYRPYDKAGSYGIQEWIGMVGVERIEGCYYNVMGLPLARLYKELQRLVDGHFPLVHQ